MFGRKQLSLMNLPTFSRFYSPLKKSNFAPIVTEKKESKKLNLLRKTIKIMSLNNCI